MRITIQDSLDAIRTDHTHGASYLARQGAQLLTQIGEASLRGAIAADAASDLILATCRDLIQARQSMAPLVTTACLIAAAGEGSAPAAALPKMIDTAHAIIAAWETAPAQIAAHVGPLLGQDAHVVTLSRSATVNHSLTAHAARIAAITALESRPSGEGIATARELAQAAAWQVKLVPDAAMLLALDDATHVIVGADALLAAGAFANKTGTHPLAQLAHDRGIPVLIAAERLKVAPTSWRWQPEVFAPELLTPAPLPGVTVIPTAFECAPLELGAVISERGALSADAIAVLANDADRGFCLLFANRSEK